MDISRWQHTHTFGQDVKQRGETRTMIVIAITGIMMAVEIATGLAFGSMALLADGVHMASHAVALSINVFAYIYARRNASNASFSFGTGKVNALGGYSGAILLAIFAVMMAVESIKRLISPTAIAFNQAICVAVLGLLVNGASVFILGDNHTHHHGGDHEHPDHDQHHEEDGHEHEHGTHSHHHHGHDHNLRSAYLHVLADALTSVTAIIALLAAKYFGWIWMDPVMGIAGSLLVAHWSIGLLRQSSRVLLDRQAPSHMMDAVREAVEQDGHSKVADLHVWSVAPNVFSVILSVCTNKPATPDEYRKRLDPEQFPHVTVEVNS